MSMGPLPPLVGQNVVVILNNGRTFLGNLICFNTVKLTLLVWNGRRFIYVRIPLWRINNIIPFPCGPTGARFVVVRLAEGGSLVGCQILTSSTTTTTLSLYSGGNNFSTVVIENTLIGNITVFPSCPLSQCPCPPPCKCPPPAIHEESLSQSLEKKKKTTKKAKKKGIKRIENKKPENKKHENNLNEEQKKKIDEKKETEKESCPNCGQYHPHEQEPAETVKEPETANIEHVEKQNRPKRSKKSKKKKQIKARKKAINQPVIVIIRRIRNIEPEQQEISQEI